MCWRRMRRTGWVPRRPRRVICRQDLILDVARRSGADAIHPGYGFLSENPDFAEACAAAGVTFIGPPGAAMRALGSKTLARQAADRAQMPRVPGSVTGLASIEEAQSVAAGIGFPVMLKAAAGGGGKGMRAVNSAEELAEAFTNASSEAQNSFGSSEVYLEKLIDRPRHIEIQLLADLHGNCLYLGERECSVQRRHQKVIEEAPSAVVSPDLRRRMGEAAVRLALSCGYVNAGTVEFLVHNAGQPGEAFYFLEMNTRLQVEHPVTELVTGLDLVHLQILVAEGKPLPLAQSGYSPARPCDRMPHLCRRSRQQLLPLARPHHRPAPAAGAGDSRGRGHLRGLRGAARLRPDAVQADRVCAHPRGRHCPSAGRAGRLPDQRHRDQSLALPPHSERPRLPHRGHRHQLPGTAAGGTATRPPVEAIPPEIAAIAAAFFAASATPAKTSTAAEPQSLWREAARREALRA